MQTFRIIKPEIRVVGIDDGAFSPHVEGSALVVGVVFRGGLWLDGVMHTRVEVDGMDANDKIGSMIADSPHSKQLRVIMLNGVTCAGFNVIDIRRLHGDTGLPVIAVTRKKPDFSEIRRALENLPNSGERWASMQNAGELHEATTKSRQGKAYMHIAGVRREDAEEIVRVTSTRSYVPEPLRVAHLVASGLGDCLV